MPRRWSNFPVAALAVLLLGGCYEHVVKETGVGSSRRPIYEPNVVDDADKDPWNTTKKSNALGIPGGGSTSTTKKPGTHTFDN